MTTSHDTTPAGQRDMIDMLVHDHREVEEMFTELESGTGDPDRRRQAANAVIAELVRHSVAEEQYLYPTVRHSLPDGDQLADREIAEHAQAERTMKDLERVEATEPEFDTLLAALMTEVRQHIREEEGDLFPRLRTTCDPAELRELGSKVELVKRIGPTRPHPSAPDRPPADKVLGPVVGLVDRVRDGLSGRATSQRDL